MRVDLVSYLPLCRSPFLGRADSDRVGSQASQCSIHELQDWVRRQPLPDIMG